MKFSILKEHKDHFNQKGFVEFESCLTDEQADAMKAAIDRALQKRLSQKKVSVNPEESFLEGRDLWREDEELARMVCQKRLAELAYELTEKKPIRLAYDQLFPGYHQPTQAKGIYDQILQQNRPLNESSCIKNLLCGLIVCYSDPFGDNEKSEGDIFPTKKGNGVFLRPDFNIDLSFLNEHAGQGYLMIVYGAPLSFYYLQTNDPHTHYLKRLGYVFNDKLKDNLHPIVLR